MRPRWSSTSGRARYASPGRAWRHASSPVCRPPRRRAAARARRRPVIRSRGCRTRRRTRPARGRGRRSRRRLQGAGQQSGQHGGYHRCEAEAASGSWHGGSLSVRAIGAHPVRADRCAHGAPSAHSRPCCDPCVSGRSSGGLAAVEERPEPCLRTRPTTYSERRVEGRRTRRTTGAAARECDPAGSRAASGLTVRRRWSP